MKKTEPVAGFCVLIKRKIRFILVLCLCLSLFLSACGPEAPGSLDMSKEMDKAQRDFAEYVGGNGGGSTGGGNANVGNGGDGIVTFEPSIASVTVNPNAIYNGELVTITVTDIVNCPQIIFSAVYESGFEEELATKTNPGKTESYECTLNYADIIKIRVRAANTNYYTEAAVSVDGDSIRTLGFNLTSYLSGVNDTYIDGETVYYSVRFSPDVKSYMVEWIKTDGTRHYAQKSSGYPKQVVDESFSDSVSLGYDGLVLVVYSEPGYKGIFRDADVKRFTVIADPSAPAKNPALEAALDRAYKLRTYSFTPQNDISDPDPRYKAKRTFKAGKTYQGFPYLMAKGSLVPSYDLTYQDKKPTTYEGFECASYIAYILGYPDSFYTQKFNEVAYNPSDDRMFVVDNMEDIRVGDVFSYGPAGADGHVVIISAVYPEGSTWYVEYLNQQGTPMQDSDPNGGFGCTIKRKETALSFWKKYITDRQTYRNKTANGHHLRVKAFYP
jgi:hypothetical protein